MVQQINDTRGKMIQAIKNSSMSRKQKIEQIIKVTAWAEVDKFQARISNYLWDLVK